MAEMSVRLRLAIAGGGTGGHVLPALAVVDELRKRNQVDDLIWIGSQEGLEGEAAQNAGIRFVAIPTGKLRRYFSLRNITDSARIPLGILAARRELRAFRPSSILSTGGFVSVPTVLAARGVAPVVTHEQTAILGLATRINARFSTVLAISHHQTGPQARTIHRRVAVTGNPIRPALADGDRVRGLARFGFNDELPLVYVTGGARGASPINRRVSALLPDLLHHAQVLHQTGPANANTDASELRSLRNGWDPSLRQRYVVVEFVREELSDVYAAAELALGRAGAGTVAELAHVGLPAILIPLPGAGGDEQTMNARVLGEIDAAVVLPQAEATADRLRAEIMAILGDAGRRKRMSDAARTVARPDAAAQLADILVSLGSSNAKPTPR